MIHNPVRALVDRLRESYSYADQSPVRPLTTIARIDEIAARMKAAVIEAERNPPDQDNAIFDEIRRLGPWFQRIDLGGGLVTTSLAENCIIDDGGINSLGRRLEPKVASMMRPTPKWELIEPILPNFKGKTVLELGCNAGFFSFQFLQSGASRVRGVEIIPQYHRQAEWCRQKRGVELASFVCSDFVFDEELEKHDFVFASEVINHCLYPFRALARMLSLAREFAIFDTGIIRSADPMMRFGQDMGPRYHSFDFSDGMIMRYFRRIGVEPDRVIRYASPVPRHMTYIIDVSQGLDLNFVDTVFK